MRDSPGSAPAALSGPGRVPREALARTTGLNLLSGALPLLVALVMMPVVIRGFGVERYGVLATAMVLLAYLALLDLGLGRAVTSFLSRSAREGDGTATCEAFWTALGLDLALGVAAGAALALLGPALVGGVLKVPSELVGESRRAFRWLARQHGAAVVPRSVVYEAVRMLGFQCGRWERLMPRGLARRLAEAPRP